MPKRKTKKQIKADKRRAGSLGGTATFTRHGPEHMRAIGKRGAATTWTRYSMHPYGLTQYALKERATGKLIKIIGRAPSMESILGE